MSGFSSQRWTGAPMVCCRRIGHSVLLITRHHSRRCRSHYSTKDGSSGWKKVEAAEAELICHGWSWLDDAWNIDLNYPGTDSDGWGYAVNFGSIDESSTGQKGMTHFVRRRRRIRTQIFIANQHAHGTCDHCDLNFIEKLSNELLEALTKASVHVNPMTHSEVATIRIKNALMETLGLASISETMTIEQVQSKLQNFVQILDEKQSRWAKVTAMMASELHPEKLAWRAAELTRDIFALPERTEIAKILIRKYDGTNQYHCAVERCGDECEYAPMKCSNEGCYEEFSRKWWGEHDGQCPYKIIPCSRECGVTVVRQHLPQHLSLECELRPAECPYKDLGCKVSDLSHRQLSEHMENDTQHHMYLMLQRVTEEQHVIVKLNHRCGELERVNTSHGRQLHALEAGAAAVLVSMRRMEETLNSDIAKEVSKLDKKYASAVADLTSELSSLKKNFASMERERRRLSASNKDLATAVERISEDDGAKRSASPTSQSK